MTGAEVAATVGIGVYAVVAVTGVSVLRWWLMRPRYKRKGNADGNS